jgi:ABC-type nickel/cobalt efflux system permease component RcnA
MSTRRRRIHAYDEEEYKIRTEIPLSKHNTRTHTHTHTHTHMQTCERHHLRVALMWLILLIYLLIF